MTGDAFGAGVPSTPDAARSSKPSEQIAKECIFRVHLLPAFGRRRLDEIRLRDVEPFKADKLATLSPKRSTTC